jgi:hypothetical protein
MRRVVRAAAVTAIAGLAGSAAAVGFAPALMPDGYSWLSHTTSESAAQGIRGAWLARSGFVLFGLSVLLLVALTCRRRWGPVAAALHATFGAFMLATAVFSTRPWQSGPAYDRTEDLLHSVAATGVGFAFALGVGAVLMRTWRARRRQWPFDVAAVLASVLLPLAMSALPGTAGAWQRLMFAIAYAWYATEAALPLSHAPRQALSGSPQ